MDLDFEIEGKPAEWHGAAVAILLHALASTPEINDLQAYTLVRSHRIASF